MCRLSSAILFLFLLFRVVLCVNVAPPSFETHVFIPHGVRKPAIPPDNRHSDSEVAELLVRPYFPVRPADYQGYRYTLNFTASYRAYAYHNGVYLGYSADGVGHERVVGYAGYGDVFSIVARARGGLTGVIAAVSVGPYRMATGIRAPNGFKVASRSEMESDGRYWKFRNVKHCMWKQDPIVLPVHLSVQNITATGLSVIRSRTFPYNHTGAQYVWASGRETMTDDLVWIRYVVGGLPCPTATPSPSPAPVLESGNSTCYCQPIDEETHANKDCYQFIKGHSPTSLNTPQRCRKRVCTPGFKCVNTPTNLICMRKFVTTEIRKATIIFNGKCILAEIPPKPVYFLYEM